MPPTLTEAFPPLPLRELLDLINEFEVSSPAAKNSAITRLVAHHAVLSVEWGQDWRYRRVRKLDPEQQVTNADHVIWRKGQSAAPGRVNPANFDILYLADRLYTAFAEARVTDDRVAVAEFQILPGRSVRLCPIGELFQIQRTGHGFVSGDRSSAISRLLNACQPLDVAKAMLITDAFLYQLVTGQDDYEVSAQVTMSIFERLPGITAIAYSSRLQPGAINVATRVEHFWDDWGLTSVRSGHAKHLACGFYEFSDVRHVEAVAADGKFTWSDHVQAENELLMFRPPWTPGDIRGDLR